MRFSNLFDFWLFYHFIHCIFGNCLNLFKKKRLSYIQKQTTPFFMSVKTNNLRFTFCWPNIILPNLFYLLFYFNMFLGLLLSYQSVETKVGEITTVVTSAPM